MSTGEIIEIVSGTYEKHGCSLEVVHHIAKALSLKGLNIRYYRALVVMLSALQLGHEIGILAQFTGYDYQFVSAVKSNLETAGIWDDGDSHHQWNLASDVVTDEWVATGRESRFWTDIKTALSMERR
jgi:hypothetical protein